MTSRGLIDPKGELFAYLEGDVLYTLDGEPTGRLEKDHIVDMAGNPIWRVFGDGVYAMNGIDPIGYFGEKGPQE